MIAAAVGCSSATGGSTAGSGSNGNRSDAATTSSPEAGTPGGGMPQEGDTAPVGTATSGTMGTVADGGMAIGAAQTGGLPSVEAGAISPADSGSGEGAGIEAAADDGNTQTMPMDYGIGDGSDVILMGDSWMSNTLQAEGTGGGIAPALIQTSGQPYRNYGVQGVMMLQADTFGPAIPTQYETAKQINPNIKTVVMTGGGNDIIQNPALQSDCQSGGSLCKMTLDQISQTLNTLWTEMAGDGVHDVVYIRYADSVSSVAPSLRGDGGVATPSICLTGSIRCWSVDTNGAVMSDVAADGIHPLQVANQRIAMQVYALMAQDGMRR